MGSDNVVLIGFMGAGKSTVGRALARVRGADLVDTDALVEEEAGAGIREIFDTEGEHGFREREERAVTRACAGSRRVIACGGGAVTSVRVFGILKGCGTVVYLRAPAEALRERVGGGRGRPLLDDPEGFDRLLAERIPLYESAADLIVDTEGRTADEVAAEIDRLLGERKRVIRL